MNQPWIYMYSPSRSPFPPPSPPNPSGSSQCIIQSEVSQKDKDQYSRLTHIYGIYKDGNNNPICKTEKETQMYRTDFWTLWEKARVGCFKRTALKHVYYLG